MPPPPSPALRYSPSREQKVDSHKRGRSLEGGLLFEKKDDDLELFNEMQAKERDNFLLQSSDDFEDTFATKLRNFSDIKLGISIPVRGESSELLNADGEKNDYDWLLTPPDTPLFPSLDDEPPAPNVAASRGRPRSQPITISRSSTMEKRYRCSRGSASPNRSSPSPRSGNSSVQSRGRPSSAPYSSPTRNQHPATPSRRPSPPPSKTMTAAPRSVTPTPRRMSTGSVARGTSPIRTSRGNSASPKIKAWQSNIPGFSSEIPPNLRTSLGDRPASFVRGSSPASRNGRESSAKFSRQSMSPTASRSVTSSYGQDRDRASSNSKGSLASSGDDDVDSLQSVHIGSLDRLTSKRVGLFPNNRTPAFSKKSTRITTPSSAPKRSFNSASQQMDQRKSPQNMFRPLLSSVPSTTFYVGKSSSAYRSLTSRNSSITTSSNASPDQVTGDALDTEGSDQHVEDMTIESRELRYHDAHEEVFAFDKAELLNKDGGDDVVDRSFHHQLSGYDRDHAPYGKSRVSVEFSQQEDGIEISSASNTLCVTGEDFSEVDSLENTQICSTCGCRYLAIEIVEKDINLCPDCRKLDNVLALLNSENVDAEDSRLLYMKNSEKLKPSNEPGISAIVPESQSKLVDMMETGRSVSEENETRDTSYYKNHNDFPESFSSCHEVEGEKQIIITHQATGETTVSDKGTGCETGGQQILLSNDHSNLKVNVSEGAGMLLLLKRSSSSSGPFVQGRTFVASTVTYDDLSYARESTNSFKSSMGHTSTSASSSVDFSSSRQVDIRFQRQYSGRRAESEIYRNDINVRPQSSGSSGTFCRTHSGVTTSVHDDHTDVSVGNMKYDGVEETAVASCSKILASRNKESCASDACLSEAEVLEENSCKLGTMMEENLVASLPNHESTGCSEGEELPNKFNGSSDVDVLDVLPDNSIEAKNTVVAPRIDVLGAAEDPTQTSIFSEADTDVDKHCQTNLRSENDGISSNSKNINEFQDSSVVTPSEKDMTASTQEYLLDHVPDVSEESTVMVEYREGGSTARSLTLEEATDAILFCSSIVHDLAYKAATIAIEKESSSIELEGFWPTVTIPEKPTTERNETRGRNTSKRTAKSQKVRPRQTETDAEPPSVKPENDENANESGMRNVGLPNKMDNMKPQPKLESKCNCTIM